MTNITDENIGCWIDGSRYRSDYFMFQVIRTAYMDFDFEIDFDLIIADLGNIQNGELDQDELLDILDSLDWTYTAALDHMNDQLRETPYYFEVEDQSVYLAKDEPAEILETPANQW
jgi:metal-sulfur cluster biosynthetic enzyme